MNIGNVLKSLRKQKRIKQYIAATRIGISQTYLSQIEANKKEPAPDTLRSIAKYYKVSTVYINFMALEEKDIPKNKIVLFRELAQPIKDLLVSMKE